jgi:hypothetical protein
MTPADIVAGARTVAQVATHLEELKGTVEFLRERASATGRGYFSPHEDEAVRHLLVSYWHARNALYELAIAFRDDTHLPEELRPRAFLVVLAGVSLLVAAARFLREAFDGNPTVRAKLNEPEPYFSIPAGVYDTVQASLTSPRNAWHLYHALHYWDAHAAELKRIGQTDPDLAPAWAVVERYGAALRVPGSQYAKARAKVRAHQAGDVVRRDVVGRALYGLVKLASSVVANLYVRPGHHPELPGEARGRLGELMQAGDVLVTRKEFALTNYFLPGFWPHAALYLGSPHELERLGVHNRDPFLPRWRRLLECDAQEPRRVLEAMKDGVWLRSLSSPFGSDAIVVLRPQVTQEQTAEALARGMFHEGKPYDFDFDFTRSDRLVCTEVVYRSYDGVGGIRFPLFRRAGRMTLAAEDILRIGLAREGLQTVAVYSPTHAQEVLTGAAAEAVLQSTIGPPPT